MNNNTCQRGQLHKVTTLPVKDCSNPVLVQVSIPSWQSAFIYNICEDCQNEMLKHAQDEYEKYRKQLKESNRLT